MPIAARCLRGRAVSVARERHRFQPRQHLVQDSITCCTSSFLDGQRRQELVDRLIVIGIDGEQAKLKTGQRHQRAKLRRGGLEAHHQAALAHLDQHAGCLALQPAQALAKQLGHLPHMLQKARLLQNVQHLQRNVAAHLRAAKRGNVDERIDRAESDPGGRDRRSP